MKTKSKLTPTQKAIAKRNKNKGTPTPAKPRKAPADGFGGPPIKHQEPYPVNNNARSERAELVDKVSRSNKRKAVASNKRTRLVPKAKEPMGMVFPANKRKLKKQKARAKEHMSHEDFTATKPIADSHRKPDAIHINRHSTISDDPVLVAGKHYLKSVNRKKVLVPQEEDAYTGYHRKASKIAKMEMKADRKVPTKYVRPTKKAA